MTESRSLTREGALIPFAFFPLVAIPGRGLYSGYPIDLLDAALFFAFGAGIPARAVILGSVAGAGSAAAFWWIARRHLPGAR